ncbi:GDSL esterase/lipase At1g71250-like [Quercus robur]|uniref:GDSL esterase/lipase At1g71250-like n=1 Tax=Quercus robur TaxID=38942 RepID=UPI0021619BED|nr:GDSL esterase/lipase At1g71250-like [Quercus robur]
MNRLFGFSLIYTLLSFWSIQREGGVGLKRKKVRPQKTEPEVRRLKEKQQSLNAKMVQNTVPPKGLVLVLLVVVLMGLIINVANGKSPDTHNVMALYVLGDSSVDCGDNTLLYPLIHHNFSLYPCDGSDSSLLPYLLAEKMSLPNILPFYSQNGSIAELQHGLNFGSAEATILEPRSQSHQSLNQQLRQVFEIIQLLQLQLGQNSADHFIKSSMVYLSFSKDDYIDLFLGNSSGVMLNYNSQEFAHILVNQMIHVMRILYNANFRKIICTGILPLGCTPRTVWKWYNTSNVEKDGRGCVKEINDIVLEYNTMLNEHIVKLNSKLPDAQIVFCDVYQGIMEIITKPANYGFEEVRNACCGAGTYGAIIGCLSQEMACDQASSFVWWDLYNPTPAVNSLLADSAWSGRPFSGMCHPITIQELINT